MKHMLPLTATILAAGLLLAVLPRPAEAERGASRIEDLTLVADNGRLLRGSRWALDILGTAPQSSWYDDLKDAGLNALHVYAESFAEARCRDLVAGHRASLLDDIVDITATKGLYVVITIGNGSSLHGNGDPDCLSRNGEYDRDYATAFWNFYAGRYATRSHVIYEIQNEPYYDGVNSHPSPSSLRQFEIDMYNLIRSKASQVPILVYSYAVFNIGSEILSDLQALGSGINWTHTAVAFHGYGGLTGTEAALEYVTARGYPVIQTEFFVFPNQVQLPDIDQTDLYERTRTSWLTFVDMPLLGNPTHFTTPIAQAGLVWAADHGDWPAKSAPPFGSIFKLQARDALFIWNYVEAQSTTQPLKLVLMSLFDQAKYQVIQQPGKFWVALKSINTNRYVSAENAGASPLIADRTGVGLWEQFDWLETPTGTIYLKARVNNLFVNRSGSNLVANSTRGWITAGMKVPSF